MLHADLRLIVVDRVMAADDVVSLRLATSDGSQLPLWQPGHHIDIVLPSGKRRQYSLCGDPRDRNSYLIAVRRLADGAGGSREVHDDIHVGAQLTGRGPWNAFPYLDGEKYLFIAGGIGITPILPMVRMAQRLGAKYHVVYVGRSKETMPFLAGIEKLPSDCVTIHAGARLSDVLEHAPVDGVVYCCGPESLLSAVRAGFADCPARSLHFERFTAPSIVDGTPFSVLLRKTGALLEVSADESALSAIRRRLPGVAYSCQQGFCGTCRVNDMLICTDRPVEGTCVELDL
jgi:ferredoxin-NADP reductase